MVGTDAAQGISTETTGFGILPRDRTRTAMRYDDWADEDKVRRVYYNEIDECVSCHTHASCTRAPQAWRHVEGRGTDTSARSLGARLFKREFGATRTIIFDHTIRRTEPEGKETPDTASNRKPVARGVLSSPLLSRLP